MYRVVIIAYEGKFVNRFREKENEKAAIAACQSRFDSGLYMLDFLFD